VFPEAAYLENREAGVPLEMVPAERIELPTFGLQNRCTTAVLRRLIDFAHDFIRKPVSIAGSSPATCFSAAMRWLFEAAICDASAP
jgi:hypothetical protein